MVTAVTNLGRSGLSDWLTQRVTAIVLLAYMIFITVVLLSGPDYASWKALFSQTWVKVFSVAAILSVAMHAWIGMWSVSTDYLTERALGAKATVLRLVFQAACAIVLFTYVVWGIQILWS